MPAYPTPSGVFCCTEEEWLNEKLKLIIVLNTFPLITGCGR